MSEDKSDQATNTNYGHASDKRMQTIINLTGVFVKDGKVTDEGVDWLHDALEQWGPGIVEKLRPELKEAAEKILAEKEQGENE